MPQHTRNRLLAKLSPDAYGLLAPHLRPLSLVQGTVLYEAGDTIGLAYFPETAIVSIITHLPDAPPIECGSIGADGAVGFIGAASVNVALRQTVVQLGGDALVIDAEALQAAVDSNDALLDQMLWYAALTHYQALQLIACNAHHSVEQRLARWLMQFYDRTDGRRWPLRQGDIAQMLGVRRASVTAAAQALQKQASIEYHRGTLEIRYR